MRQQVREGAAIRGLGLHAHPVVPRVVEEVHERVANFARRPELPRVVAVGEHRAAPAPETIEGSRDADEERLKAPRERVTIVRFGDFALPFGRSYTSHNLQVNVGFGVRFK